MYFPWPVLCACTFGTKINGNIRADTQDRPYSSPIAASLITLLVGLHFLTVLCRLLEYTSHG